MEEDVWCESGMWTKRKMLLADCELLIAIYLKPRESVPQQL